MSLLMNRCVLDEPREGGHGVSDDPPTWHPGWSSADIDRDRFAITTARPTAELVVVEVVGELDIATCPEFDVELDNEMVGPPVGAVTDLIVDFTRMRLLSARAVCSVLRADATARDRRVRLQVVIPAGSGIAEVSALLDLDGRVCVRPDLAAARRALGS
jgi:anti-anti-sigma regulatory factor